MTHITIEKEKLKLLVEALSLYETRTDGLVNKALAAGKEALAQPEQEFVDYRAMYLKVRDELAELQQCTWVGLTLTQVKLLWEGVQEEAVKSGDSLNWVFYTHINEALKEKNT